MISEHATLLCPLYTHAVEISILHVVVILFLVKCKLVIWCIKNVCDIWPDKVRKFIERHQGRLMWIRLEFLAGH